MQRFPFLIINRCFRSASNWKFGEPEKLSTEATGKARFQKLRNEQMLTNFNAALQKRMSNRKKILNEWIANLPSKSEDAEFLAQLESTANSAISEPFGPTAKPELLREKLENAEERRFDSYSRKIKLRPPSENNMLTWAAKQQIWQLNEENPEQWTPERIAEGFPVSIEGARRLLGSRFRHFSHDSQFIRRHDELVKKRWDALKNGPEGVLSDYTQELFAKGRIKYLPMFGFDSPISSNLAESKEQQQIEMSARPGSYLAMIRAHLKEKDGKLHVAGAEDDANSNINNSQIVRTITPKQAKKSVAFSYKDRFRIPVQHSTFRDDFSEKLQRSRSKIDRKYQEWLKRRESDLEQMGKLRQD